VREVSSNAGRIDNIIEAKLEIVRDSVGLRCHEIAGADDLCNLGICLEEKGQRLADSTLDLSQIWAKYELRE
jgi:hypothetical protein